MRFWIKMAIGQSHDQPTAPQNTKACRRVERLMFDASLKGEWRSSGPGDVLETGLRAEPLP